MVTNPLSDFGMDASEPNDVADGGSLPPLRAGCALDGMERVWLKRIFIEEYSTANIQFSVGSLSYEIYCNIVGIGCSGVVITCSGGF